MQMGMGGMVAPGMMPAMMPGVGMNGRPDFLGALQPHQPPVQSQHVVSLPLGMQQPPTAQQSQPWHAPSMSMPSGLLPGSSAGLASLAASPNPATANGHFSMPLQQGACQCVLGAAGNANLLLWFTFCMSLISHSLHMTNVACGCITCCDLPSVPWEFSLGYIAESSRGAGEVAAAELCQWDYVEVWVG